MPTRLTVSLLIIAQFEESRANGIVTSSLGLSSVTGCCDGGSLLRAFALRRTLKAGEVQAAMSMARLWRDQGKRTQARELLASVYGWFTEGFDTLDLKQAKALLDEQAS
jgi:hypothetical protein